MRPERRVLEGMLVGRTQAVEDLGLSRRYVGQLVGGLRRRLVRVGLDGEFAGLMASDEGSRPGQEDQGSGRGQHNA